MTARLITTWLVDDDDTYRAVLLDGLSMESDLSVTGYASCEDALQALKGAARAPEVILLDITLPGMSGIRGISEFRRVTPRSRIVMLTHSKSARTVEHAPREGAFGFVVKATGLQEVTGAIRDASRGERHLDARSTTRLLKRLIGTSPVTRDYGLTEIETRVLYLMTKHYTRERIAAILQRNVGTVIVHQEKLYQKLGVSKNTEAVVKAIMERLV